MPSNTIKVSNESYSIECPCGKQFTSKDKASMVKWDKLHTKICDKAKTKERITNTQLFKAEGRVPAPKHIGTIREEDGELKLMKPNEFIKKLKLISAIKG